MSQNKQQKTTNWENSETEEHGSPVPLVVCSADAYKVIAVWIFTKASLAWTMGCRWLLSALEG